MYYAKLMDYKYKYYFNLSFNIIIILYYKKNRKL